MKVLKRLICIFLVTLIAVTGMASAMALQEDTRTEVATIVATSDMAVLPTVRRHLNTTILLYLWGCLLVFHR